jgi:hypothetical protein
VYSNIFISKHHSYWFCLTSAHSQQILPPPDLPALRLASLSRVSSSFASIYARYSRNFDGQADILDLATMKVLKDCGDLKKATQDGVWEGDESDDQMDGKDEEPRYLITDSVRRNYVYHKCQLLVSSESVYNMHYSMLSQSRSVSRH